MLHERTSLFEECIGRLVAHYGFTISVDRIADSISLVKPSVSVVLTVSDPRHGDVQATVNDLSVAPPKGYLPLYMLACRQPELLVQRRQVEADRAAETFDEEIRREVCTIIDDLDKLFPDLLAGDFSVLQARDRYDAFVADCERLSVDVVPGLDYNDPVNVKVRDLDFSWVADLQNRLGEA